MERTSRFQFNKAGTRFLIYPQPKWLKRFREPEKVYINAAPGTIQAGPQDERIYVVDFEKKDPFKHEKTWKTLQKPPYRSKPYPGVEPKHDGHFDHLDPRKREFRSAAVFATVRCVLEIWEHYFGRPLPWFFRNTYPRLELIPHVESLNSWSGEGFLEFGYVDWNPQRPYCLHLDAVAHEAGHLILKSVIGNPTDDKKTLEYRAHEEGSADLVSLVAVLHFDSVVNYVLEQHQGKLFSINLLSRIGELRAGKEIRTLFNDETMSSRFTNNATKKYDTHSYSLPFSGAAYDILIGIYHSNLGRRKVVPGEPSTDNSGDPRDALRRAELEFPGYFKKSKTQFMAALADASAVFAHLMARAWERASVTVRGWERGSPDEFSYAVAAANILAAAEEVNSGEHLDLIRRLFECRKIQPAPPT